MQGDQQSGEGGDEGGQARSHMSDKSRRLHRDSERDEVLEDEVEVVLYGHA